MMARGDFTRKKKRRRWHTLHAELTSCYEPVNSTAEACIHAGQQRPEVSASRTGISQFLSHCCSLDTAENSAAPANGRSDEETFVVIRDKSPGAFGSLFTTN